MACHGKEKEMPAISVLMKPSSGICNMSCSYCFYCDETQKRAQESFGFMSEQTLRNIIRKTMAHAEGMISYAYQGGEPTLRGISFFEKAIEYQKHYNRKGIRVYNALQTNGLAIDGEWCRFFAENHFLVGVSVDGTEETHDAYRRDRKGNGTFGKVLEATKMMDAYGVEYNILTVVNQGIAEAVSDIYQEYHRRGWKYQQFIACLDPLGEGHSQNSYSLTAEQYGSFLIQLFDLWYADLQKGKQPYIRQFENYIGILLGYHPEACDQVGTCGIQYVVEADGSVYPCDFYMLDEYRLGDFNENKVPDINQRREEIGFVERSGKLEPACRECQYFRLCRGGCQRHRDQVPGEEYYTNYFCKGFQIFFQNCEGRMREIAEGIRRKKI